LGLHIIPNHFYQPVPDTRFIPKSLWDGKSEMIGVRMNDSLQLQLIQDFKSMFYDEYNQFPPTPLANGFSQPVALFYSDNPFFGPVDAEFLYCMIRYLKPNKVIEVGSGYTTYLSAQAILVNQQKDGRLCDLIAIEPYPNKILQKGFPGLTSLKTNKLQEIPFNYFNILKENDILFIDSSHILNIGSDVAYLFLEILPRLNSGVYVHIHDIYLPYEYPRSMIFTEKKFYNEQYLLQSFLINNYQFEVVYVGYYLHKHYSHELKKAVPRYDPSSHKKPVSFWIRKK
jgi:hypothetical protein